MTDRITPSMAREAVEALTFVKAEYVREYRHKALDYIDQTEDDLRCAAIDIEALEDERDRYREALEWYEAKVAVCNRHGRGGDEARNALAKDGGRKARRVLEANDD